MIKRNFTLKENFDLAIKNHSLKKFNIAKSLYEEILIKAPDHIETNFLLGTLFVEINELNTATEIFKKIIKLNPKHALSLNNLGMIYAEMGKFSHAISFLKNAIIINPNLTNTVNNLCILIRSLTPKNFNEEEQKNFKELFLILFKRNDIDHFDIFLNAKNILFYDKKYKKILEGKIMQPFLKSEIIANLIKENLFLLMMQKSLIVDEILENLLIKIRKEILTICNNNFSGDIYDKLDFIISLAQQCYLNEYVYIQTESEVRKIQILKEKLEKSKTVNELDVAVLGCYISLSSCKKLQNKLIKYKSKNLLFNDLIKMQIRDPDKEKQLKITIKSLNKIDNQVSKKVQNQYEENPYPRWRYLYSNNRKSFLLLMQNQIKPNKIKIIASDKFKKPNVLVAGCGTGRHLFIVDNYSNAKILGVDLSLTSLAYAKRKVDERGLKNIEFLQSDILDLKKLKRKFDVIESVGVLHHMKEPLKGIGILVDLLEPHGFLKLGLYSKIARNYVTYAKNFISKNTLKTNLESIRNCRNVIFNEKNDEELKKITSKKDFYSTSSVRDLIFNEQEYYFNINEISEILREFKLEFLGFSDSLIKGKYSKTYKNDPKNILLDNWHNYEKINQNVFSSMYSFWVKKIN
ncbi:MAG: SAM-dependent methyltransferase/putative Zn-dependent protease [Pelagibacterales bacterium]|nr:SAM-dependent methyltransferase/putative Zn-dependent protease [Pelagibacterales bacterium]